MAGPRDDRDVPAITREMFTGRPDEQALPEISLSPEETIPEISLQPEDPWTVSEGYSIPQGMTFPSTSEEFQRQLITPIEDLGGKVFDPTPPYSRKAPSFPIGRDFNDSPEVTSILDSIAAAIEKENLLLDRGWTS